MLNSKIIISKNIKMDKQYTNVVDYSESDMVALCTQNQIAVGENYSFLRPTSSILVNVPYGICLQANYIAFQNKDYSNKWFFAWIDDVIYKSEKSCELTYTIDVWSTWFSKWSPSKCFVNRHHVSDDVTGKYTLDENLDVGEVIAEDIKEDDSLGNNFWIGVLSSWNPVTKKQFDGISVYNKTFFGNQLYLFDMTENTENKIENLRKFIEETNNDAHIEDVKEIFIVPEAIINADILLPAQDGSFFQVANTFVPQSYEINISKLKKFSDYQPKNQKCFVYPYNYLYVSNNSGGNNIYKYENFSNNDFAIFELMLAMSVGVSGKLVPARI